MVNDPMTDIPHIVSSANAAWSSWTMLGLLLCGILSEWFQPGVITQAPISLMVRNDRTYKDAPVNFMGQFLITLFRIGTIALMLCLCWSPETHFSFTAFWATCGVILLVFLAKMLCNGLIDYTFSLSRRFGAPYEHYGNLLSLASLILYPILLVLLRVSSPISARWCLGIVTVLFCLIWLYRCIRSYLIKPTAILYLIIYTCTLEILPFIGLAYISAKMIAIL